MILNSAKTVSFLVTSALASALVISSASAADKVQQLPIEDFLNVVPGNTTLSWIDPATNKLVYIDGYGKLNAFYNLMLGTTTTGGVKIKQNKDGTQTVTVSLRTKNALCYGAGPDQNNATVPYLGSTYGNVIFGGAAPSLGDTMYNIEYSQPSGPLAYSGAPDKITSTVMCDGKLTAASGLTDGADGFVRTTQVGRFLNEAPDRCPPEKDANCFPSEKVDFREVGAE